MATSLNNSTFSNINTNILVKMLQTKEKFVSGALLAADIGVSRVSIHSHLEQLRKEGFAIEAIRNRGYRVTKLPITIQKDLLNAYLKILKIQTPVIHLREMDSTQNEAERQISNSTTLPFVVITGKQTAGRGRHGRSWYSKDSGNLYASFAFRPNFSPKTILTITPWLAVNLCHLLNEEFDIPAQVKWPNDLILRGKKISGMLAESRIDMDHTRDLIFGIGLNINGNPETWPKELQSIATSMTYEMGKSFNINQIAAAIIKTIFHAYHEFSENTFLDKFNTFWKKYDSLYDQFITGYHGTLLIKGTAKGISEAGKLKLLQEGGTLRLMEVGEVSLSQPVTQI